jgi:hypothetical protein
MCSYSLSLWERVRVRGCRGVRRATKPLTPRSLPWGEGAGRHLHLMPKKVS